MTLAPAPCDDPETLDAFLTGLGLEAAWRKPLAGDASSRRYQRLELEGLTTLILMQSPAPAGDMVPFLEIGALLERLGFSVPGILAHDLESGLMLLEDFGDGTFSRLLATGADAEPLYALATDVLIELHRRFAADKAPARLPVFDEERFAEQGMLFTSTWLPLALNRPALADECSDYEAAWRAVLPAIGAVPVSLLLRDYHVDNLVRLPNRDGIAGCGLLDFQDAGLGPVAYDLVSLLEDARRDVPPALAEAMTERYLAAFPALPRDSFLAACDVLAAVRHTRILAVFTRLAVERRRRRYLAHLPRVWRLLEARLQRPALAPVRAWFDHHLPPHLRADFTIPESK
jgi:aminoglycoside/choline kinase family phosphotransferase